MGSESETERKPEVPASTRDEALFHCTTPSGDPRGPYQLHILGFPGGSDGKESTHNVGDLGSIPVLERSSGEGNGIIILIN